MDIKYLTADLALVGIDDKVYFQSEEPENVYSKIEIVEDIYAHDVSLINGDNGSIYEMTVSEVLADYK
jgi:hypothetical protein